MQNYLNHYFYAVLCSSYPLLFCKVVHPVQGALLGFLVRHTQDVVRLEVLRCKMRFECSNTREVRLDTILCLPIPFHHLHIFTFTFIVNSMKNYPHLQYKYVCYTNNLDAHGHRGRISMPL